MTKVWILGDSHIYWVRQSGSETGRPAAGVGGGPYDYMEGPSRRNPVAGGWYIIGGVSRLIVLWGTRFTFD